MNNMAKIKIKHPNEKRLEEALKKLKEQGKLKDNKKKIKKEKTK